MKNKVMSKALSWVLAAAMTVTMSGAIPAMATSVYADTAATETTIYYSQISGKNRYATGAAIAEQFYKLGSTSTKAVLVTGQNFPDALSAAGLAGLEKAPLLMTRTASLPDETKAVITGHKITSVTIIGSEKSVSKDVETALTAAGVTTISRVFDTNRQKTAEAVEAQIVKEGGKADTVVVATGAKAADALSISSVLYKNGWPMLLASNGKLSDASLAIAKAATKVYVLGDEKAVSADTMTAIGTQAQRISGKNRYATSEEIAKTFAGKSYDGTAYASGLDSHYPDALVGGMLMGVKGAPILLVSGEAGANFDYTASTVSKDTACKAITFLGDTNAVPAATSAAILKNWTKNVKTTDYDSTIAADQKMTAAQAGAKTITVTFATAITDASKITVMKGKVAQSIDSYKLSDDGKTVTLTMASAIQAADYTVSLGDLSAPFKGAVAVLTTVEFASENLVLTQIGTIAKPEQKAQVILKGKDQFGSDVAIKKATFDQMNTSVGTIDVDDNGVLTITGTATTLAMGAKVAVSLVFGGNSPKVANSTLTVVAKAVVNEISLGDITTDSKDLKNARLTSANLAKGDYYLPVTAKDQYGNTLTAAQLNNMVEDGTLVITPIKGTYSALVNKDVFFDDNTAKDAIGLYISGDGVSSGASVITVLSTIGKSAQKTITVLENEKVDALTAVPDGNLEVNKAAALTVTATNQYEENIDLYKTATVANTVVTLKDGTTKVDTGTITVIYNNGTAATVVVSGGNVSMKKDSTTKTATFTITPTAKAFTIQTTPNNIAKSTFNSYTAADAASIEGIKGISDKIATTITKGATVKLNDNANVLFLDSDGDVVTSESALGLPAYEDTEGSVTKGYAYTVTKIANTTYKATSLTGGVIKASEVSSSTTESYVITLYKDNKVVTSKQVAITVIPTEGLTYTAEVKDMLYTGEFGDGDAADTKAITLKATDANGKEVAIDQTLIVDATVSSPSGVKAEADENGVWYLIAPASTAAISTDGATKEGQVKLTVETTDTTTNVTAKFNYSSAKRVSTNVVVKKGGDTVTANTISVDGASADKAINGYTLSFTDQYGRVITGESPKYIITNYKNAVSGDDKTCDQNANYTDEALKLTLKAGVTTKTPAVNEGDTFNLTVSTATTSRTIAVTIASN